MNFAMTDLFMTIWNFFPLVAKEIFSSQENDLNILMVTYARRNKRPRCKRE